MSTDAVSPLRQRMIDNAATTRRSHHTWGGRR